MDARKTEISEIREEIAELARLVKAKAAIPPSWSISILTTIALVISAMGFSVGVYTSISSQIGVLSTAVAHNEERNSGQDLRIGDLRTDINARLTRMDDKLDLIRAAIDERARNPNGPGK
jgi:hypothetical protein